MRALAAFPLLSVVLAVPVSLWARGEGTGGDALDVTALSSRASALSRRVADLEREGEDLLRAVERIERRPAAPVPAAAIPEDREIAESVALWLDAHHLTAADLASVREAPAPRPGSLADLDMAQIVQLFLDPTGDELQVEQLFQELRDTGRIDEFVEWIERIAGDDPENPELQVARGVAYLEKLFDVGSTPEAGVWAMKADQAFDGALELDPRNWDARFTKAVALSNWPAFLGKTGEAISHFETLIAQQEESEPAPRFAQTYLFLGNMYVQTGEKAKAIAVWRAGLARHPDDPALLEQLRLMGE